MCRIQISIFLILIKYEFTKYRGHFWLLPSAGKYIKKIYRGSLWKIRKFMVQKFFFFLLFFYKVLFFLLFLGETICGVQFKKRQQHIWNKNKNKNFAKFLFFNWKILKSVKWWAMKLIDARKIINNYSRYWSDNGWSVRTLSC
jgi:hypothetical protein